MCLEGSHPKMSDRILYDCVGKEMFTVHRFIEKASRLVVPGERGAEVQEKLLTVMSFFW